MRRRRQRRPSRRQGYESARQRRSRRGACRAGTSRSRPATAPSSDRGTQRHSTYRSESVVVHYRWHPLHQQTLHLFRRVGVGDQSVVHVDAPKTMSKELPAWMCDAAACSAFSEGSPVVSVWALMELRAVLTDTGIAPDTACAPISDAEVPADEEIAEDATIPVSTRHGPDRHHIGGAPTGDHRLGGTPPRGRRRSEQAEGGRR